MSTNDIGFAIYRAIDSENMSVLDEMLNVRCTDEEQRRAAVQVSLLSSECGACCLCPRKLVVFSSHFIQFILFVIFFAPSLVLMVQWAGG